VLNKATGKTSVNSFAFNEANWGSATRGYMKSVRRLLRLDCLIEIIEMARSLIDRSKHSEHTADPNDLHANLVAPSDDE
jgi:hypothetical protein